MRKAFKEIVERGEIIREYWFIPATYFLFMAISVALLQFILFLLWYSNYNNVVI